MKDMPKLVAALRARDQQLGISRLGIGDSVQNVAYKSRGPLNFNSGRDNAVPARRWDCLIRQISDGLGLLE
jgi:hypothetical protein